MSKKKVYSNQALKKTSPEPESEPLAEMPKEQSSKKRINKEDAAHSSSTLQQFELTEQVSECLKSRKYIVFDDSGNLFGSKFSSFEEFCGFLVNRVFGTSEHPIYKNILQSFQGNAQKKG
jgi:TPP-dependent 2-oxoacid decarboxylase